MSNDRCPYTELDVDECSFEAFRPSTKQAFDNHVKWHLKYEAARGTIIDNGDGTYSLPEA